MGNGTYWNDHIKIEIAYKQKRKKLFYEKHRTSRFRKITEEQRDEIFLKAYLWNEKYKDTPVCDKLNILYDTLCHRNNNLGIAENDETFLFLIAAFDPELKLLQLYYDINTKDEYKIRCIRELGFDYDERLYLLEKYYNDKFPTIEDDFNKTLQKNK